MTKKRRTALFLASRSARRKALLKEAGIPFRVVRSNFKEHTFPGGPKRTVVLNAVGKAAHAQPKPKRGIILGADTIVYFKGRILGKPKTKKEAHKMLLGLSGSTHDVYTGLALFDVAKKKWKTASDRSRVTMREFDARFVADYFSKVNPLDKAGAYAIQEHGDRIIQQIKGSYSNVVGLSVEKLQSLLSQIQVKRK